LAPSRQEIVIKYGKDAAHNMLHWDSRVSWDRPLERAVYTVGQKEPVERSPVALLMTDKLLREFRLTITGKHSKNINLHQGCLWRWWYAADSHAFMS